MKASRKSQLKRASAPTGGPGRFRSWLPAGVVLLVGVAVVLGVWYSRRNPNSLNGSSPSGVGVNGVVPAVLTSTYQNTKPNVKHVGSQACVACHEGEHASFLHTGMGRSMAEVDLAREPPDGAFDHPATRCRYEVRRKDGQMWHRELLLTGGSEEVLLQEHPVKYACGSGHHSLTYLVEDDGFLVESPITWYASRNAWGISPGYDQEFYKGFERDVGETCLYCHAGRIKALEKSLHRMQITEAAIGCEQCHGPGELHVQRHEKSAARKGSRDAIDDTIVNPARLPRELSEAVCQYCHLWAGASVLGKGKSLFDFRPGLSLAHYRQDFQLDTPSEEMKVVGHVEQMHQSACYRGSKTFSCLTCHDPHGEPIGKEQAAAHYIQVCQNCHEPAACRVNPAVRERENPANDCIACHMPRTKTDIPHLAFTHHRVGIHAAKETTGELAPVHPRRESPGILHPMFDISHLPEGEQKRQLGFAYLELLSNEPDDSIRRQYTRQVLQLLTESREEGGVDGAADSMIARLRMQAQLPDALRFAQAALADPNLGGQDLCNALYIVADSQMEQKRYKEASATLDRMNRIRRDSTQWLLKAQCELALGNDKQREEALQTAVRINPRLWKTHSQLADFYRRKGNAAQARFHELRAVP